MKPPSKDPHKSYEDTHWGLPSKKRFRIANQVGMPAAVTEMGKLIELRLRSGRERFSANFEAVSGRPSTLVYDAPPRTRLYLGLSPAARNEVSKKLIQAGGNWYDAGFAARSVGGRQAKLEDRAIQAQIVGHLTHVIYETEKQGDGPSHYVHKMGEEGGISPYLGVDVEGHLYVLGGSYGVANAGIFK